MTKTIRWTDLEKKLLHKLAWKLHRDNGGEYSILSCLRVAQLEVLPVSRRRDIHQYKAAPWIVVEPVESKEPTEFLSPSEDKATQPVSVPTQETVADVVHLPRTNNVTLVFDTDDKNADFQQRLLASLDALPQRIEQALTTALAKADLALFMLEMTESVKCLSAKIDKLQPSSTPKVDSPACSTPAVCSTKEQTHKPLVLLVNLLGNQYTEISRAYGSVFDLRLWEGTKGNQAKLKSLASTAYRVLAPTNFLTHSDDANLAKFAKERYLRYTGSLSTLKTILSQEAAKLKTLS